MPFTLIHFFSVFSLALYVVLFFLLVFSERKKLSEIFLLSGIITQFVAIFFLVSTEYRIHETGSTIDSSPSLLLLICSLVVFLLFYIVRERSKVFAASFVGLGIIIFILGSLGLHSRGGAFTYEISSILLVHILFSVLSQVSVFFVLLLSFLIVVLHRRLKKKQLGVLHLPNLSALEKMLTGSLQGVAFFLVISLVSGAVQKELLDVHIIKLLFSLGYFICFSIALVLIHRKMIAIPVLSFYLFISTLVLLFSQFAHRML